MSIQVRSHTSLGDVSNVQSSNGFATCFRHACDMLSTCLRPVHARHASLRPGFRPGFRPARLMEFGFLQNSKTIGFIQFRSYCETPCYSCWHLFWQLIYTFERGQSYPSARWNLTNQTSLSEKISYEHAKLVEISRSRFISQHRIDWDQWDVVI